MSERAVDWVRRQGGEIGDRVRFVEEARVEFAGVSSPIAKIGAAVWFEDEPFIWSFARPGVPYELVKAADAAGKDRQ